MFPYIFTWSDSP